jgi:hypothetical protein
VDRVWSRIALLHDSQESSMTIKTKLAVAVASALLAFAASSAVAKGGGNGHGRGGSQGASHGASMGMHGGHGQGVSHANRAAREDQGEDANDRAGQGGPPFAKFKGLDTNGDGVLSSDEAAANTDVSADFITFRPQRRRQPEQVRICALQEQDGAQQPAQGRRRRRIAVAAAGAPAAVGLDSLPSSVPVRRCTRKLTAGPKSPKPYGGELRWNRSEPRCWD